MRDINKEQASQVVQILIDECGYRVIDPRDRESFIMAIIVPQDKPINNCREYRFCGALGFGGKFRNNGNHDNTPYVDCYGEDETPARHKMIEATNKRLKELFALTGAK